MAWHWKKWLKQKPSPKIYYCFSKFKIARWQALDFMEFFLTRYIHVLDELWCGRMRSIHKMCMVTLWKSVFFFVCNKVEDFNDRNSIISRKLLKQGFLYHKLRKTFAKFYNRHFDLVEQFNSSMIKLIEKGTSHPHFYGDFLKKIKKK